MVVFICSVLVACSLMTYRRNQVWKDPMTLWNDVVRLSPNKARPFNNRGTAYKELDQYELAIQDYNRAIFLKPDYADAYFNRANAHQFLRHWNEAIRDYQKALEFQPGSGKAYNNLAVTYFFKHDLENSRYFSKKALGTGYEVKKEFLSELEKASGGR